MMRTLGFLVLPGLLGTGSLLFTSFSAVERQTGDVWAYARKMPGVWRLVPHAARMRDGWWLAREMRDLENLWAGEGWRRTEQLGAAVFFAPRVGFDWNQVPPRPERIMTVCAQVTRLFVRCRALRPG